MQLDYSIGKYPHKVSNYFSIEKLGAFYDPQILTSLLGDSWYSILISHNNNALLHTFEKKRIQNTNYYDIEPMFGYSGPVFNTTNKEFIDKSLAEYSNFCNQLCIIAELIRFNPLSKNHIYCIDTIIQLENAKKIVIINNQENKEKSLNDFSPKCRNKIRKAITNSCYYSSLSKNEFNQFKNLYFDTLKRNNANSYWFFDNAFFERIMHNENFKLHAVIYNQEVVSCSISIIHEQCSHYLLTGNKLEKPTGANEYLIMCNSLYCHSNNSYFYMLGGGNSTSLQDPLFKFKKKFNSKTYDFYIGKIVHDFKIYNELCDNTIVCKPSLINVNYFLKYRLVNQN